MSMDLLKRFEKVMKAKTTPSYFLEDRYFINWQGDEAPYPFQKNTFTEFYRKDKQYKECSVAGGMGGGKTRLTALLQSYDVFDLLTRENPARDWGLASHARIFILCIAKSDEQAADTIFNELKTIVSNSQFFNEYAPRIREYNITFDRHPDIEILATGAASAGSTVGRNVKAVGFDEIDSYDETQSQRGAWQVYARIRKSTNRFGFDGHVFAISSPWHQNSVIMQLAQRKDEHTLALLAPTWDMNPTKPLDSPEMQAELDRDPDTFWRDYGVNPQSSAQAYYPDPNIIKFHNKRNVLTQVGDNYWDLPYLSDLDQKRSYILSTDPGMRDDCFGTVLLHNEGQKVIVDGISRLVPSKATPLKPTEIKQYLLHIVDNVPVRFFVTDQLWFYAEALEEIAKRVSVDNILSKPNTKAEHDELRTAWYEEKLELCPFPYIIQEFQNLRVIDSKKIGIVKGGKIDVVDALTRGYWAASQKMDAVAYPNVIVIL